MTGELSPPAKILEAALMNGLPGAIGTAVAQSTHDPYFGGLIAAETRGALELAKHYAPGLQVVTETLLHRSKGMSRDAIAAEVDSSPVLADMVTLILREIPTSTADPDHLRDMAAALGHAVTHEDDRWNARAILTGLTQLTSHHVRLMEAMSETPPGSDSAEWPIGDLDRMMPERDIPDWRFLHGPLQAAGFVAEHGGFPGGPTCSLTAAGGWALKVLGRLAEDEQPAS